MEISKKLSRLFSEKKQQSKSLDRKLATACQQFFTQSVEFRPASRPDSHLESLRARYKPLNTVSMEPSTVRMESEPSTNTDSNLNISDSIPVPRKVLYNADSLEMGWKRVRSIGAGLSNMGNTCFLNSVLQCLSYTPPLVNYLLSGEHKQNCGVSGFCALCEFAKHCSQVHSAVHGCVRPTAIVHNLRAIAKHFRLGRQEDAHEFLRYFIDGMQKSCLHGYPAKLDPHSKATTVVHQIFGGYHRSQVKCLECMKTSDTFDPLLDVSVDIKNCTSLMKALQKSIKPDLLEGDNSYACPHCKKMTKAQKRFTIQHLPRVLTVQLKRFDFNSMFGGKVNKTVSYPEHINMRPFMSSVQGPSEWYRLYAVLVHFGFSCHSGHYYCYVRNSNKCWYCMNDSQVTQVSVSTVLQQEAYLLFYIRDESYNPPNTPQGVRNDPNFLSTSKKPLLGLDKVGTPLARKPTGVVPPSPKVIPPSKDRTPINGKRTQEFSIPIRKTPVPITTNKTTPTVQTGSSEQKKPVFIPRQIKAGGKVKKSHTEKEKLVAIPSLSPLLEANEDSKEEDEELASKQGIPLASAIQSTTPTCETTKAVKTILDYANSPLDQPARFIGPTLPSSHTHVHTHAHTQEEDSSGSPLVAIVSPHSSSEYGSKPVALVRPSPHLSPDNVKLKQESKKSEMEETPIESEGVVKREHAPPPSPVHAVTPSRKHTSPPPQSSPQVDSTTSGDVTASPEAVRYGPDLSSNQVTSTLEQSTPSPKPVKFKTSSSHSEHKKHKKIYRKHSDVKDRGQRLSSEDREATPSKVPPAKKVSDNEEGGHRKKSSHDHNKSSGKSREQHHHGRSIGSPPPGRSRDSHHGEGLRRKQEKRRDSPSKSPQRLSRSKSPPHPHYHAHTQPLDTHHHRHHSHRSHSSERVKHRSRSRSPRHRKIKLHSCGSKHPHESSAERVKHSHKSSSERVKYSHEPSRDRVKHTDGEKVKHSYESGGERVKEKYDDIPDKVYRLKRKKHRRADSQSPEGKRHTSDIFVETPKPSKHITEIVWDATPKRGPGGGAGKWDGSKSSDTLHQLTSKDRVRSWEGGASVLEYGPPREERRRRDSWDEELDRGKVKKVKKKREDDFGSSNQFQDFHNRRAGGGGGPHYHRSHKHHKPHYHRKDHKWHHH